MKSARDEAVGRLRDRAEALIARSDDPQVHLLKRDVRTLLHDLSVHQVELEMQHEELQEASRASERARDEYQNLYNNAPVGYLSLDAHGIILKNNQTFSALLDTSHHSYPGISFSQLMYPEDRDIFLARYKAFFKYPLNKNIDVRLERLHAAPLWVRLSGRKDTCFTDTPETIECLLLTVADISREKQAEIELLQAKEASEAVSLAKHRFLSVVAHEFHTPLGLLAVSMDILDRYWERLSKSERQEQHQQIRNAAKQMTRLVDSVIAFNRQETTAIPTLVTSLDVQAVSRAIADEVNAVWNNGHRFELSISPDCGSFLCDELLFRQILSNLLSNSFRFTPTGGVITLGVSRRDKLLILEVNDSGIGIPRTDQGKIFEAFYRSGNVEGRSGLGLGLSIVRDAVHQMSGRLDMSSLVGVGTKFRVEIPLNCDPDWEEPTP